MSLRIQIALLFLAGGLVLSDAAQAQAAPCFTVSGEKASVTALSTKVDGMDYAFPKDACPKK